MSGTTSFEFKPVVVLTTPIVIGSATESAIIGSFTILSISITGYTLSIFWLSLKLFPGRTVVFTGIEPFRTVR